jgi:hypothetical protein
MPGGCWKRHDCIAAGYEFSGRWLVVAGHWSLAFLKSRQGCNGSRSR